MVVKLSQNDIVDLRKQGYSDQEISKAVGEIEKEEMQGSSEKCPIPETTHRCLPLHQDKIMTLQCTNWN